MPCFHPLTAYYSKDVGSSGKRGIVFNKHVSLTGVPFQLPCGRCIGCRLERSRQWAVRCMHENKLHSHSAFVTLTYDPKNVPEGGSLVKRDLQLFMKRLRKKFGRDIRFYGCGEYGDTDERPHYHLLLWNVQFPNLRHVATTKKGGKMLYTSDALSELWPQGFHWIGDVTFESAAYVARYIVKKVTGAPACDHYQRMTVDGEIIDREPEFTVMSRRPGVGSAWFDRYHSEVYAHDSVIARGRECKPPRFYDIRFELLDTMRMEEIRKSRRRRALANKADSTEQRLRVREACELKRLAFYQKRL